MEKHVHLAKFISTNPNETIVHGTKVLVDMSRNGHTKLKPVKKDDGSEIPFRVVATGAKLNTEEYDVVETRDDYTVLIPIGARVKHADWMFANGDTKKKIAAIAQIKELVLRAKRAKNDFSIPATWHDAMSWFTTFSNTENSDAADRAFEGFKNILHAH